MLLLIDIAEGQNEFCRPKLQVNQVRDEEKFEITVHDSNFELSIVELERFKSILGKKKFRRPNAKFEGACLKLHVADIIAATFDGVVTVQSSEEQGTKYMLTMRNEIEV